MKQLVIYLFITSFFFGCVTSYNTYSVSKHYDEFEQATTFTMQGNYITASALDVSNSLMFNAMKHTNSSNEDSYFIVVDYYDIDWLFVEGGESLDLLIDSEKYSLWSEGSFDNREVLSGISTGIKETIFYPISPDLLKKISEAKQIKLKLIGKSRSVIRELDQKHINNFKKFVTSYVN